MRGKATTYEALYFLLDGAVDASGNLQKDNIPKTVVFIDGRSRIFAAVQYLRLCLHASMQRGRDDDGDSTWEHAAEPVQEFTARVASHDRKLRWEEFIRPDSRIRIMVATTVIGTGINIADIKRVVVYGFPIDRTLAELWQRLGRGGRTTGMTSCGYSLPYLGS